MSKLARLAVLVAASLSVLASLSATASAVTWHNTGNSAYTAAIGVGTLSSTGVNFICTNGTMTATVANSPFVGVVWAAETGTATFTSSACGNNLTIDCAFTVTAVAWTDLATDVTHANVDTSCGAFINGTKVCSIVGAIPSIATNPTVPTTAGTVTSQTTSNLIVTNGAANCPLGNGDRAHLSIMKATIVNGTGGSGTLGPIITRTA